MRRSLFVVVVSLIATSSHAQPVDPPIVLEEFDIPTDGDGLVVPVKIGDQEYRFIVDTGCIHTVFVGRLKPLLGSASKNKLVIKVGGELQEIPTFECPSMRLGNMPLAMGGVLCLPLDDVQEAFGSRLDGVLGMDVLGKYVVRMDFDRGKLTFLERVGRRPGLPVWISDPQKPSIVIQTPNAGPTEFAIDTGCISSTSGGIHAATFSKIGKNGVYLPGDWTSVDAAGTTDVRLGLIKRFSFAGLDFADRVWCVHDDNMPNLLSLYFLTQFNVTFDFPRAVIYLTRSKHFGRADAVDLSGLALRRVDGRVVIESIDENSPAEKCDLRAGDVIKTIGESDVNTSRLFALRRALCEPGDRVRVVLDRDSETIERELILPASAVSRNPGQAGGVQRTTTAADGFPRAAFPSLVLRIR